MPPAEEEALNKYSRITEPRKAKDLELISITASRGHHVGKPDLCMFKANRSDRDSLCTSTYTYYYGTENRATSFSSAIHRLGSLLR